MDKQRAYFRAIAEKVENIFANTDHIAKLHIGIFADAGEIPTVRYSVEEIIYPDEPDELEDLEDDLDLDLDLDSEYDCENCGDCVLEKKYR